MPKTKEITAEEQRLILRLNNEKSLREIAEIANRPFSTVRYIINTKTRVKYATHRDWAALDCYKQERKLCHKRN